MYIVAFMFVLNMSQSISEQLTLEASNYSLELKVNSIYKTLCNINNFNSVLNKKSLVIFFIYCIFTSLSLTKMNIALIKHVKIK